MLRIDDTIFSFDILETRFKCDLSKCLGNCCRYGDSGAPLLTSEVDMLNEIWPDIKRYLRPEGIEIIENYGTSVTDKEFEIVTPLINNEECAYAILNGNIFMCGIEKAWSEGKIDFRKPLSCHLFPVRLKQYSDFKTVNYEKWSVCSGACARGKEDGVYLYEFLKESLIRATGKKMYSKLCIAAKELRKQKRLLSDS